jgi:hypothetical protein
MFLAIRRASTRRHRCAHRHRSEPSRARSIAGLSGFLILSQSRDPVGIKLGRNYLSSRSSGAVVHNSRLWAFNGTSRFFSGTAPLARIASATLERLRVK